MRTVNGALATLRQTIAAENRAAQRLHAASAACDAANAAFTAADTAVREAADARHRAEAGLCEALLREEKR